ncbi:hypothetical protein ACSSS7_005745 [Eimeria intestinalis]
MLPTNKGLELGSSLLAFLSTETSIIVCVGGYLKVLSDHLTKEIPWGRGSSLSATRKFLLLCGGDGKQTSRHAVQRHSSSNRSSSTSSNNSSSKRDNGTAARLPAAALQGVSVLLWIAASRGDEQQPAALRATYLGCLPTSRLL